MKTTRRSFLILLLVALITSVVPSAQVAVPQPASPLILISFDGWRWDYADRAPTPNLHALMASGVTAERLIPSFPSKTFPNHYSIVTGLVPGHHGIVANYIKDIPSGRNFATSKREEVQDPMWWGGEPIWVTAEKAGVVTASLFWPGSEAPINGIRAHYWQPYDESVSPAARVDQVLAWLDLPREQRPAFISVYFSDMDDAGHEFGPDAPQTRAATERLDAQLGRLLAGLRQRGTLANTNIVVVSDHGMSAVTTDRVIVVDDYISLDDVEVIDINPLLSLVPKAGREDAVYRALVNAHPRLHVYRRDTMPPQWRYDHPRVSPIFATADEGWQVLRRSTLEEIKVGKTAAPGGVHGYDPAVAQSMGALFVASGPAFRQNARVPAFQNVHIYNALARALGVTPAANDGDPAVARSLLR